MPDDGYAVMLNARSLRACAAASRISRSVACSVAADAPAWELVTPWATYWSVAWLRGDTWPSGTTCCTHACTTRSLNPTGRLCSSAFRSASSWWSFDSSAWRCRDTWSTQPSFGEWLAGGEHKAQAPAQARHGPFH